MRHWRTTGNSTVAIQTGSTCISDSKVDSISPTTNQNALAESVQSDRDIEIERQPAMGIRTEIVIPPELHNRQWRNCNGKSVIVYHGEPE